MPGIVFKVEPGSGDPSPVAMGQFRDIENVIQMAVCDYNSADRNPGPSSAGKRTIKASGTANET